MTGARPGPRRVDPAVPSCSPAPRAEALRGAPASTPPPPGRSAGPDSAGSRRSFCSRVAPARRSRSQFRFLPPARGPLPSRVRSARGPFAELAAAAPEGPARGGTARPHPTIDGPPAAPRTGAARVAGGPQGAKAGCAAANKERPRARRPCRPRGPRHFRWQPRRPAKLFPCARRPPARTPLSARRRSRHRLLSFGVAAAAEHPDLRSALTRTPGRPVLSPTGCTPTTPSPAHTKRPPPGGGPSTPGT